MGGACAQCLDSVGSEVIAGRMCESFPGDTKWPLCVVVLLIISVDVCAELILDEATNALSHKMVASRLSGFPRSSLMLALLVWHYVTKTTGTSNLFCDLANSIIIIINNIIYHNVN